MWSGNKNIIWTYNDPDGGAYALSSFTVKLSQDNGVTYPITIASGVAPSGSPQTLVLDTRSYNNSVLCKIKITGVDGKGLTAEDISNAVFSIKNAGAPVVSAPADMSVSTMTPVFSWENVSDDSTVSYRLLLSTTADFTSGSIITYSSIAQGSGTTSYTVSSPLTYGDWYWKVLATFDGESFSPDSLVRVIYADNAPTVTVTAPNGGELWSGNKNIIWTYNDPDGGAYALSSFTVKLSQDNGVTYPITIASGVAPSGSPQTLVLDTRSYNNSVLCKIKITGVDGKGLTAEDISNAVFSIKNAGAPVVSAPADMSVSTMTPVFSWENVSDDSTVSYRLLLSTTADFTSGSIITYSSIAQGSGTTSYTVSSSLAYGTWNWKVLATFDGESFSPDSLVRVIYADNAPTVTVTAPNGGELWSGNKNIIWTYNDPDGGAYALSSFTVKLSQDNGVTYPITIASGVAPSGSPQTLVLDTRSYNNSVLCKIKITGVDGKGITGEDISNAVFSIKNAASAPVVSAPEDLSVTSTTPVFSWGNVSDDSTVSYRLLLSTTADFTSGSIITYSSIAQGSGTTSYTVSSSLAYGTWNWKVLATFDGESFSPDSLVRVIYADNAPTVTVTAPNGGEGWSGTQNITWTYNDPDGGAYALSAFTVKLSQDNGATYPVTLASGAAPSGSPQSLSLDTMVYVNSGFCKIKVIGVDGKGVTGEDLSNSVFAVNNANEAPVVTLTTFTGGGSFSNAQTISWTMTDVNGPDSHTYDIKLSSDGGISYSTTVVTGLTGLSYSWVTGNHVNGNQYRVKVIALDNGSPQLTGESFSGSNFTINNSNQAPKVFSLLTPLTGAVLSDDTPTLAWQNNGDPDSGLGDTITQFKVHYSVNSNFAGETVITGVVAAEKLLSKLTDGITYYWKIEALDTQLVTRFSTETFNFKIDRKNIVSLDTKVAVILSSTLADNTSVSISSAAGDSINKANAFAVGDPLLKVLPGNSSVYTLDVLDSTNTAITDSLITAQISFTYADANSDGIVDSTVVPVNSLRIFKLSSVSNKWEIVISGFELDTLKNKVSAAISRAGVYAVLAYVVPDGTLSGLTNYPNPFSAGKESTKVVYVLTKDSDVELRIYTLSGDMVLKQNFTSGGAGGIGLAYGYTNEFVWDGKNGGGSTVANGMYICELVARPADGTSQVREIRRIGVIK